MNTSGFFKVDTNNEILYTPNGVTGPNYELTIENKDTNNYPIDGWYWFDSYFKAIEFFSIDRTEPIITILAFLNRFTDEEAITIDLASIGATVEAASMRRFMSKVNAATKIDLSNPETIGGVRFLESVGILKPGRADIILLSPILDNEKP